MKKILTLFYLLLFAVTVKAQSTCSMMPMQSQVVCYANGCNNSAQANFVTTCPGPVTYFWMPSGGSGQVAFNLCPGTYTVTAMDACGCSATQTFTLTQDPQIFVSTTYQPASCGNCTDGSATATASGGTAPFFYMWNTQPPQNTATASNLPPGTYVVTVVDANGCTQSDTVVVTFSTGIANAAAAGTGIRLKQNPVNGQAVFELKHAGTASLDVYNALGVKVDQLTVAANQQEMTYSTAALPAGMYFCRFTAGALQQTVRMIVVN